jgi:hemerythrin-like domain-containing protein
MHKSCHAATARELLGLKKELMERVMRRVGIIQKLVDHHKFIKADVKILHSSLTTMMEKKIALQRILKGMEPHLNAEEEVLYQKMAENDEVRELVLEGFEEHTLIDLLSSQLKDADFETDWTDEVQAKATVFAQLLEQHFLDEESRLFPELANALDKEQLIEMGEDYEEAYQKLKNENRGAHWRLLKTSPENSTRKA